MNMPAPILPDAASVEPAGAKMAAAAQAGQGEQAQWDALVGPDVLPTTGLARQVAEAVAAGVAAATVQPATAYTVRRRLRALAPASGSGGASSLHVLPAVAVDRLVERVMVSWPQDVVPIIGTDHIAAMFVTPANPSAVNLATGPDPDWIGVDGATVGSVASPSVTSPFVVFDPPAGYYLEAGKAFVILSLAPATGVRVQWAELPATEA